MMWRAWLRERWSSNRLERYEQTPSPSLLPHPNLGATASAQGRQARSPRLRRRRGASLTAPLPPPGGKEQNLSPRRR